MLQRPGTKDVVLSSRRQEPVCGAEREGKVEGPGGDVAVVALQKSAAGIETLELWG